MANAKLGEWYVVYSVGCGITGPTSKSIKIHGIIFGDDQQRFDEGDPITTSIVLGKTADGKIRTRNSTYELLDVDPLYEKRFPNAKEILLINLPVID